MIGARKKGHSRRSPYRIEAAMRVSGYAAAVKMIYEAVSMESGTVG
jgi:hypothetical protein